MGVTTKHTAGLRWRSSADVPNSVLYSTPMTPTAPTLRGARPGACSGDRESALWDLMVRRDAETALAAPEVLRSTSVRGSRAHRRASAAAKGEQEERKGARDTSEVRS